MLEETPWIRQAESETEQMKRIAILFDLNQMNNEFNNSFNKLLNTQSSTGGFPWFDGGNDNRYITTHIVSGFGKLKSMGIEIDKNWMEKLKIDSKSIAYIDQEMAKEYDLYLRNKNSNHRITTEFIIYMRGHFSRQISFDAKGKQIKDYFLKEFEKENSIKVYNHKPCYL